MAPGEAPLTAHRQVCKYLIALLVLAFVCVTVFHVFRGEHDVDEGFYTYASWWVFRGHRPYQDFFFTQVPMVPYVYGGLLQSVGLSLHRARALSALLGMVAVGSATAIAWRRSGPYASLFVACALCTNVVLAYNFAIVKTYALAALFLTLGVGAFLLVRDRSKAYLLAAVLFSLASLTRLSLAVAFPVLFVHIVVAERGSIRRLLPALGVASSLGALFLLSHGFPDPGRLAFNLIGGHLDYGGDALRTHVLRKFFMAQRVSRDFGLLLSFFSATVVVHCVLLWGEIRKHGWRSVDYSLFSVGVVVLTVAVVHILPQPSVSEYLVVVLPCAAIYTGCAFATLAPGVFSTCGPALGVFALAAFCGTSFHRANAWFDWTFGKSHMEQLAEISAIVRRYTLPGENLLTIDRRLAVETGTVIPHRFIMNNFFAPEMSDDQARRFHMVNGRALAETIHQWPADVVVFGAAPHIDSHPAWSARVAEGYRQVGFVPDYGPYHGDVCVYVSERRFREADVVRE